MNFSDEFSIFWDAPIIPSTSLAGVPINVSATLLERVLDRYLIDKALRLYAFEGGPVLRLVWYGLDQAGNGGYSFSIFRGGEVDEKEDGCAFYIMLREHKVHAVKAFLVGFPGEETHRLSYKGTLPEGIGLGRLVSDLLPFTSLEFNSAEEWFCTSKKYGGLEVSGWGVPLKDEPEQVVTAMCVISGSA